MTNTPSTSPDSEYPTDWHMLNDLTKVECRQIDPNTFQLRNKSHTITLSSEGFNIYREGPFERFVRWVEANNIESKARND